MPIQLIVGLRNPGPEYQKTRHNAGFWLVEELAARYGLTFKLQSSFHAELATWSYQECVCKLMSPITFMNRSGLAIRVVSQFYRILPEDVLVVHDDLDLNVGDVRLKQGGGHGGHNGLRDIIEQLGSKNFHRLRVGIAHPGHRDLVLEYVLGKPSQQDKQAIVSGIDRALDVMPLILCGNYDIAMNQLHRG